MLKKLKNTIEGCQKIAEERDGKCLSTEYINNHTKLKWQCAECHIWEAALHNIKDRNSWCPECAGNTRKSLEDCQKAAEERDGRCLSGKYTNAHAKMEWQCSKDHIWYTTFGSISYSRWCPYCAGKIKKTIKDCQKIAEERGGKCLSSKYTNNCTKLKWQCECRHIWKATLHNVKDRNSWCPECSRLAAAKKLNNTHITYHWKTDEELVCQASWEKKVVEYFNTNKINFRWQPRYFLMPDGRKYYVDCYLFSTKKWIEIKGYFWDDAEEKWKWFHKEHPNSELWNKDKLKEMGILE